MKSRQAIEQIRSLIVSQNLKIGDRLPTERTLSETLGVSRITIREAISYLKAIGVIESRQGSGNYLLRVPNDLYNAQNGSMEYDLDETISARETLESMIAKMFLKNFTLNMTQDMEYIIQSMETHFYKDDLLQVVESDVRFHHIFSQA
ncbi:MAG: GntR family transcriptional regulator [Pseudothermotoga sp.]